jgi:hypothetical protein
MTSTPLHIVASGEPLPETVAQRIQRLQADVRALGREQVQAMRAHVLEGVAGARDVATNPAQPDGIRQLAEKIVRDGESLVLTLDGLIGRGG